MHKASGNVFVPVHTHKMMYLYHLYYVCFDCVCVLKIQESTLTLVVIPTSVNCEAFTGHTVDIKNMILCLNYFHHKYSRISEPFSPQTFL